LGLALWLIPASASAAGQEAGDPPTLELRVIPYATLDAANLECARQTAEALLTTGAVRVAWRVCSGNDCTAPSDIRVLVVHLLPIVKRSDPSMSGEVGRDQATKNPVVFVYVPRARDVAGTLRRSAHPLTSTVTTGHVVGLTVAHEVGHALGLRHRSHGPMKARPDRADIVALRAATLRFSPTEANAMRSALQVDRSALLTRER
jgi:hypothetical protein